MDGKKVYIGSSKTYHVTGKANKKYTNAKKLKPAKKKYVLKKGRNAHIRVTIVKQNRKKKLLSKAHGPALCYASSDKKIATITQKGVVKAKKKGGGLYYCYRIKRGKNQNQDNGKIEKDVFWQAYCISV